MRLTIIPKAAPPHFPYTDHRTMAEIMATEQAVADAVHNCMGSGTNRADSAIRADREGVCTARLDPDHKPDKEARS